MRLAFDDLDRPHIDVDSPEPFRADATQAMDTEYVRLDDSVILPGSLAVAGWRHKGMQGELFDTFHAYDVVPHYGVNPEVEVIIDGYRDPQMSTQEDIERNVIKEAFSSKDSAQ